MMRRILGVALIVVGMASAAVADSTRVLNVTGQGSVDMAPDMATVRLGVTEQADQAGDALAATSQAVAEILARLEQSGIASRDVQTQGLSLQPVWSRQTQNNTSPREIIGFVARNTLSIRVRELGNLGSVLDQAVRLDGANTFDGLQFSVQDPDAAMAAARAAAVASAMTKAEQLAQAAGVTLGPVVSITESGGQPRPMMMEMAAARMASDVPIAAGEVSLSAQVSMVFTISD